MRLGDRFNKGALLDRGPYVYWFRTEELLAKLQSVGFRIDAVGSSRQIVHGGLCAGLDELRGQPLEGAVYCVASKP
jgi:hypothetical protein